MFVWVESGPMRLVLEHPQSFRTPNVFRQSVGGGGGCHGDKGVLVLRNWLTLTEIVWISERECEKEDSEWE